MLSFKITFGVISGYTHDNQTKITIDDISYDIISYLETENQLDHTIPSGTLVEARTLYPSKFGCPVNGEETYVYSGCQNPEFTRFLSSYKDSVIALARFIKTNYKQYTVTVEFTETELKYIKD